MTNTASTKHTALDVSLAVCELAATLGDEPSEATVRADHAYDVVKAYRAAEKERGELREKLDTIVRVLGQDATSAREAYDEARSPEDPDMVRVLTAHAVLREARAAHKTAKRIAGYQ